MYSKSILFKSTISSSATARQSTWDDDDQVPRCCVQRIERSTDEKELFSIDLLVMVSL